MTLFVGLITISFLVGRALFIFAKILLKVLLLLVVSFLYFINPIDLIPDFFGCFGMIDETVLIVLLGRWVLYTNISMGLRRLARAAVPTTSFP